MRILLVQYIFVQIHDEEAQHSVKILVFWEVIKYFMFKLLLLLNLSRHIVQHGGMVQRQITMV